MAGGAAKDIASEVPMTPNHAVNTDAHRRRYAPWWSPVTLVR